MATPTNADKVHRQIPDEVIDNIISLVSHHHQKRVLFTFLRVSKRYSLYVAGRIYPHVTITPSTNLFADTGLKAGYLCSKFEGKGAISGGETPCLKTSFLNMIETITVEQESYRRNIVPAKVIPRILSPAEAASAAAQKRYAQLLTIIKPPPIPPIVNATNISHLIYCDQLTLRLDTTDCCRPSPYEGNLSSHPEHFLANVRPLRLVLHGASFHQSRDPIIHLPPSLFSKLEEIVVIITPGALPNISQTYDSNYGLPYLLACLAQSITSFPLGMTTNQAIDVTFILQTPNPHSIFPVISPAPHNTIPGAFDPEFAPGYLHPLTQALGQCIAEYRNESSWMVAGFDKETRRVGAVDFVNFGSLNGTQVGMLEQAHDLIQDRFGRGIRAALNAARVNEGSYGLKVVGMREWMEGRAEGGRGILGKDIFDGWK